MLLAAAGSLSAKYYVLQVDRVITDNSYQCAETFLFRKVVNLFIIISAVCTDGYYAKAGFLSSALPKAACGLSGYSE